MTECACNTVTADRGYPLVYVCVTEYRHILYIAFAGKKL